MSDWQVGDLALCVREGRSQKDHTRVGKIYEVERFWHHPVDEEPALDFAGIYNGCSSDDFLGYRASRFIKVTPPAADEFDRETIALMNRVEQPA